MPLRQTRDVEERLKEAQLDPRLIRIVVEQQEQLKVFKEQLLVLATNHNQLMTMLEQLLVVQTGMDSSLKKALLKDVAAVDANQMVKSVDIPEGERYDTQSQG